MYSILYLKVPQCHCPIIESECLKTMIHRFLSETGCTPSHSTYFDNVDIWVSSLHQMKKGCIEQFWFCSFSLKIWLNIIFSFEYQWNACCCQVGEEKWKLATMALVEDSLATFVQLKRWRKKRKQWGDLTNGNDDACWGQLDYFCTVKKMMTVGAEGCFKA